MGTPGAIFLAILPGFILTVLFFFDHNVSSLLSQTPNFKLKKGSAYHWDFFVVGINIFITGILGIPPTNGLIPQAPLHTKSLAEVEMVGEGRNKREEVKLVHEQRVSNFMQALLIGITLAPPILKVLQLIPRAALDGLFLFMGIASFPGNQFAERVVLLITEPDLRESVHGYLEKVPWPSIRTFTLIQFVFCALIFGVTLTPAAMLFPLLIASLVVMRKYVFPKYYDKAYILALDSDGMPLAPEGDEMTDMKISKDGFQGVGKSPAPEQEEKNQTDSDRAPSADELTGSKAATATGTQAEPGVTTASVTATNTV